VVTLLYQQTSVEMFWDDRDQWLHVIWASLPSATEIERDCEQMLRLLTAKNGNSVLNDTSHVEGMSIGSAEWGADWFFRMRQSGLKYFATVNPPTRASHPPVGASPDISAPGNAKDFYSIEEAITWLRTQRRKDAARTQRIVLPPGLGLR
jgi:hypothetical protein